MQGPSATHAIVDRLRIGPITHLRISGVIDETFSAASLGGLEGHVIVDLGHVERISSFGVRQWMEFSQEMPPSASGIYILNAPPMFVDQLSMVEGFTGVSRVISVLAPYTCETCSEDRLRLVDLEKEAGYVTQGEAPPHQCPVCHTALQFADLPDQYFAFARHMESSPLEPVVERYLKSLSNPEGPQTQTSTHSKIVEGDITFVRLAGPLKGDLNVRRLAAGLEGRVAYDMAHVTRVEPKAAQKLHKILETAVQGARVLLWRVPLPVLTALLETGVPVGVEIATLWLPCECQSCGNKNNERVEASGFLEELVRGKLRERRCSTCGGVAVPPNLDAVMPLLFNSPTKEASLAEFEALEPRALSQILTSGLAADGSTPSKGGTGTKTGQRGAVEDTGPKLEILKHIGQGGMAEVFLARQQGLKGFEKYVVVKKILPHFARQPDFVEMLFAEAKAAARLTHPNIVQIYDLGVMDGSAYITMEYVRGADLGKLMRLLRKQGATLPIEHSLRIIADIAAGLNYAHGYVDPTGMPHPLVHRDVSPHNILISLDGAVKLADFGIAKVEGESEHTQPGMLKGKVAYLSPEAIAGATLDGRNDIFALGVVLFELLTGRSPFRRENDAATLAAIARDAAPIPSQLNPAIPADVSAVVLRALEKNPARRYQTAGEVREGIEEAMMRHHFRASAAAVASYFQTELADALGEMALSPPGAGSGSAVRPGTEPARARTPPEPPRPPARAPAMPPPGPPPSRSLGDGDRTKMTDTGSIMLDADPVAAQPGPGRGPTPAPLPAPGRAPIPPPPRPPPPLAGPRPVPPALAQPPTGSMAAIGSPIRQPPAQRPPLHQQAPQLQAAVSASHAAYPNGHGQPTPTGRGLAQVPDPQPLARRSPARSARTWMIVGVAVVAVLGVAGGVASLRGKESSYAVSVRNLPQEHRLFVAGVRVDPGSVRVPMRGPLQAGVSEDGALVRFGSASSEHGIDVKHLPFHTSGTEGKAYLSVVSDPPGCPVQVNGVHFGDTPAFGEIEAGREKTVLVLCPGLPRLSREVLGAPNQQVQVTARLLGDRSGGGCSAAGAGSWPWALLASLPLWLRLSLRRRR